MDRSYEQEQNDKNLPWWFFPAAVIFLLVVFYIGARPFMLSDEQINFVKKDAQDDLRNEIGENYKDYEVGVSSYGWVASTAKKGDTRIVRVKFTQGDIIIYTFIDLDTGTVVKKEKTTEAQEENYPVVCC